ncbi:hypothetical protein CK203_054796 [Vitis vinifera]|uniref:Reverse transcriptase RNase H-like domain-containing protein n=1 Tax=Vitis vinifera TaxID=29760 RepID=A0A438GIL7_VITVI|nr:hypothetical protein CK203_054796 [Vitis vinifera]
MKLNLSKCAFDVSAGKFLGFMVSQRGIEVSPDQIKVVMEMPPHRQARRTGRFIARFTDELRPFFLVLRKVGHDRMDGQLSKCFRKIKRYLTQPPVLSALPGEKLYMYLVVSDWAVSAVLFRCPIHKEQNLFIMSAELWMMQKRAHPVVILTDQPLRNILLKPDLSGRMLQWAIELSEYGIEYQPRLSMKVQGFYYNLQWVNNWSKLSRLGFPASNNEAEYEAILFGLDLALTLSVSKL